MKIQKLEFGDRAKYWYLKSLEFSPNINLLVGISGAGKTKIISSILALKKIVSGDSFNGVYWDITFLTKDNVSYRWQGEFATVEESKIKVNDSEEEDKFKIISEYLSKDEQVIIERDSEKIIFKGEKVPKLSPFESIVELLNQEKDISPVKEEFNKIILSNLDTNFAGIWMIPISQLTSILAKYKDSSLSQIQESSLSSIIKLFLVYQYLPETFNTIKEKFIEIFDTVEDLKIQSLFVEKFPESLTDFKEAKALLFKEKGVSNWIVPPNISSGILKTFMYISELYLSPEGSVILIDEFENSLGVNCINSVTDLILENLRLQFIVTSHHPYIIHNIGNKYWKIITRQGNTVRVKEPQELGISQSRHQGFIDLINVLEELSE
ncbi:AAA family ATPase [Okeania sp.]|uniref:AAA family ATPase n=1 Tax=Okeania sp. TaxID=3100323 RepID=UPI002B4B67A6|nr:AAA family ATPase [Okeania sp.]MEB3342354.1 AAA family ATPase [Okeania sp.]